MGGGGDESGVVGEAEVVSEPHEDALTVQGRRRRHMTGRSVVSVGLDMGISIGIGAAVGALHADVVLVSLLPLLLSLSLSLSLLPLAFGGRRR